MAKKIEIREDILANGYVKPVQDYSGISLKDFKAEEKDWFIKWLHSVGR